MSKKSEIDEEMGKFVKKMISEIREDERNLCAAICEGIILDLHHKSEKETHIYKSEKYLDKASGAIMCARAIGNLND